MVSPSKDSDQKIIFLNPKQNSTEKSQLKGKKTYPNPRGKKYPLRSSVGGGRVLRSMSKEKCDAPVESVITPVTQVIHRRRNMRRIKKPTNNEFSRIRKQVRYLLTRINYEQNLIDAYTGEGWKGQSLEKIKPEKELERAKSEILRCKSKIRDLFQHIDYLLSEGKFEESLFDSDGLISSDDIFCAKCGSKDVSVNNDIILCDGTCVRGFHQKCLNPPLLTEDIPPGDEGWLCPACDCKVDCLDLLNEFQGSKISIGDKWEKVFPEASAIGNGEKQYDDFGLPSDDSEDNDYNPDATEVYIEDQKEGSSSGESSFASSCDDSDSMASDHDRRCGSIGLPSEDSDDDNYDPDGADSDHDEKVQKNHSSSNESDFTSDSDVFMEELTKTSDANETSSNMTPLQHPDEGTCASNQNKSPINSELLSILEPDMNEEGALSIPGKRQRERLDYKKLYDETYGKTSSDSSDDDDWCDMNTPKKGKNNSIWEESVVLPMGNTTVHNRTSSRISTGKLIESDIVKAGLVQRQIPQMVNGNGSEGLNQNSDSATANISAPKPLTDNWEPHSTGRKATTGRRGLGGFISQKLFESFEENKYPTRERKERLAEEVGITLQQVDKWFCNTRHNVRVSGKETDEVSPPNKGSDQSKTKARIAAKEANPVVTSTPERSITKSVETSGNAGIDAKEADRAVYSTPERGITELSESRVNWVDSSKGRNSEKTVGPSKAGPKQGNGCLTSRIDDERRKAIARELRKVKKGR